MAPGVRFISSRCGYRDSLSVFRSYEKTDDNTGNTRKTTYAVIMMMLAANLSVFFIITQLPLVSAQSIDQREEPAVVMGSDVLDFDGKPVDEIWVYAYIGSSWEQIPFQVDERNNSTGSYFVDATDGIMDSNDEIVFMPFDAGEMAPAEEWVPATGPQRYEVTVTDPIDASMKYAYIYTSLSLTETFVADYVAFNSTYHVITANDYTIGFEDADIGIMDEIRINTSAGGDNTDIFDRLKYRLQVTISGFPLQFDEDDFDYDSVGYKDGPVRFMEQIGSGDLVNINYAYRSYAIATQELTIGSTSPDWVRLSMDFLGTSTPMTYYDSNGNDLTINGVPDTPTSTNAPSWAEVTGSHGTIVMPRDYTGLGGVQSLYYTDDLTSNDAPESESGEYGDSGLYVTNPPAGTSSSYVSFYFLPSNQVNVGSTYLNYANNPLTISTLAQFNYLASQPVITDVTAHPDPQEVYGIVNLSAVIEDDSQINGAWVDITDPNSAQVGNYSMDYDSITGRYFDNRTYDIVGTYQFTIWAKDDSDIWNFSQGQFDIRDTALPIITDVTSLPDPQEVYGFVNISAVIEDNYELDSVRVAITDPNGDPAGNISMSNDSSTNRYFDYRGYGIVGTYQFIIWTKDTSSNWNSTFGQFAMQDTILPTISDATAVPDPQEVYGFVNISAVVDDIVDVDSVWIEITDPNGDPVGNYSMGYDSNMNRYFTIRFYDIVGTYQFIIWANDTSNNWNSSFGQFDIHDTTIPIIIDVIALPNPQEVYGFVNISAIIEDNYERYGAWVDITDPEGDPVGNFSMSYDTNRYYNEQAYDIVGMYQFIIWTNDTSDNWNSSYGQFEILDTTSPTITDSTAIPSPQDVNDNVDISAVIEDNYELDEVWINITDPDGLIVGNFSMGYDSGGNRYNNEQTYDIVGTYQFVIWVNDSSNNWNYSSGHFEMVDTTLPTITDIVEHPDPQETDGNVNISAVIEDNYELLGAWIEITDPNDDPFGNQSMGYDSTTSRYFDDRAYDIVGRYDFIIWASDSSGNWKSRSGQFAIQDTTPPIAHAGSDQTIAEGTTVTFDGSASTDNVGAVEHSWTFIDGTLQTLQGISPTYTFTEVGTYEVTLTVADAKDNLDTDTIWVNVTAVPDNTPPTIIHTPETTGKPGEPVTISAEITDDVEVKEAYLFYRQSGDTEWTQVAMSETFEDTWTAEIPSSEITTSGIEYYLSATDGTNNATHPAPMDPHQITVRGEDKGTDSLGWILLMIIIIIIIAVVIVIFFLVKPKKEKKNEIEWK